MSGPAPEPRLSWQPLGEYVEKWLTAKLGEPPTALQIADLLETNRGRYYVWRKQGVTLSTAERICQKILEVHPSLIWQDEWRDLPSTERKG